MSAKLVDITLLQKSNSVIAFAFKEAIEKARTKGAKDKQKRKSKAGLKKEIAEDRRREAEFGKIYVPGDNPKKERHAKMESYLKEQDRQERSFR